MILSQIALESLEPNQNRLEHHGIDAKGHESDKT